MKKHNPWLYIILWFTAAILLAITFSGCMSVEKATNYLHKKGKLDDVCAEAYPVREKLVPGAPVFVYDTVTVKGDSVECAPSPVPKKVKCPDVTHVVTYTTRVDTLIQENTAQVEMYKQKYQEQVSKTEALQAKLTETEGKLKEANKYKLYFYLLIGAGALWLLWPVLKRFLPIP